MNSTRLWAREKGIAVQQSSQATVTDLETSVLAAANREVGAPEVPNIFAAYADTAYAVDRLALWRTCVPT